MDDLQNDDTMIPHDDELNEDADADEIPLSKIPKGDLPDGEDEEDLNDEDDEEAVDLGDDYDDKDEF